MPCISPDLERQRTTHKQETERRMNKNASPLPHDSRQENLVYDAYEPHDPHSAPNQNLY